MPIEHPLVISPAALSVLEEMARQYREEGYSPRHDDELVKGTFGGRFEYFRDGKFKYIAYTD